MNRTPLTLLVTLLLALTTLTPATAHSNPAPAVRGETLSFTGHEIATGSLSGITTTSSEVSVDLSAGKVGTILSEPIRAPLPFSDVGPSWQIDLPAGSSYTLTLRTSPDGDLWNDWQVVEGELDWVTPESNQWVGDLVAVSQVERLHRFVQYRWQLVAAPDGRTPVLGQFELAFIDAGITAGLDASSQPAAISGYPKPAVVSRTGWGCPEGEASPDWEPEYQPVSHIIVHHTVTPNDDTDFAARVRAIWYYHAITREWGDIGYNYLVDRNGILYEGRAGGDDVIGGHAYPYNPGSLGLSFIGTYSSEPVPQPMLDSAAKLIAWKADQKGIDPHGWGWILDSWERRISGHRDVSQTACPGDVLYAHLPLLRDEVASQLDALAYTFVDDLAADLSSSDYWCDGPDGCGYDGHAYWTYSVTSQNASENWATWRPSLLQAGAYRVSAYVPYCINGHPDSEGVYYRIRHANGETTVAVNQAASAGGWVDLGVYNFEQGSTSSVYLVDLASDQDKSVWFDTVKWYWEGESLVDVMPPNNTSPADMTWSTGRTVIFRWSDSPTPDVDHYWLRIATDADLSTLVKSDYININESEYSFVFDRDYATLFWGLEAHNESGYSPPSGPWQLGVDTIAPSSSVQHVYRTPDGRYGIQWRGVDATSGVATYDIELRSESVIDWTPWLTGTTASGAYYTATTTETVWFRSRATDAAGNTGAFDAGTSNTADAIQFDHQLWLPVVPVGWPTRP